MGENTIPPQTPVMLNTGTSGGQLNEREKRNVDYTLLWAK